MSMQVLNQLTELRARLDEQRQHNVELQERVADLLTRVALLEAQSRTRKELKVA
jgi:cell division protein FtsL